jgi:serine/threonine protein kinase
MTDPGTLLETLRASLANDYEIEGFVGRGSITMVFKATERAPQRAVALRVVPPDAPAGLGERVRREARVAVNLVHANIVPIYTVGQAAGTDFYTEKFVDGCSLRRVMAEQGALPIPLALSVLRAIARGLTYAHDRRVIHRDVSGANVFVDREGGVALADTGIARAILREAGAAAAGSAVYTSPEQCAGQQIGPQADQYAVGVLAFQMLAGRPPFEGGTARALIEQHISAAPPGIGTLRPDVPPQLAEAVHRLLSKTPAERYATTRDMLAAVQSVPLSDDEQKAAVEQLQDLARRAPPPALLTGSAAPQPSIQAPAPKEEVRGAPPPPPAPAPAPPPPKPPEPKPAPPPAPAPPPPRPAEPIAAPPPPPAPAPPPPAPPEPKPAPPPVPEEPPMTVVYGTPPPDYPPLEPKRVAPALPEAELEPEEPEPAPPPAPMARVPPPPPEPVRATPRAEPAAEEPSPPRRPRPDTFAGLAESALPLRGPEPSMERPRRKIPVVPLAGGVAVVAVAAILAVVFTGKRESPRPSAVADSARVAARADSVARARADSIATYAPTPTVGWIRVSGDLPDDAIIWLDSKEMKGLIFPASPGSHNLEVETSEFQPWETRIRVRLGDTLRVNVELELKPQPDSQP